MRCAVFACVLGQVAMPNVAMASCCGEVVAIQAASMNISSTITSSSSSAASSISSSVSSAATTIVQELKQAIATSADIIKGESTAAAKDIARARAMHAAAISNVDNETRARQDYMPPPDPCASYSVAVSGASAREAVIQRSTDLQGQAIRKSMSTPTPSARAKEAVKKHKELYCNEEDVRQKRCGSVSKLPSADINATSLTAGAGKQGSVSPTFTAEQSAAAFDYTTNVVNGLPSHKLSSVEEKTPDGQLYLGMQLNEQAKISLAAQPFYDAIAFREPVPGLKARIQAIWDKMAANGVSVPESIKQSLADQKQASYYFLMKTEIDRRVNNPQWLTEMMSASPASVSREMALMQAQMLQLQFQQQMQMEMIAKLLGGLYAEQVQGNSAKTLNAMYNQVKKNSAVTR